MLRCAAALPGRRSRRGACAWPTSLSFSQIVCQYTPQALLLSIKTRRVYPNGCQCFYRVKWRTRSCL